MAVDVVHWNPRKPRVRGPLGWLLPKHPPVNNFGDLLGPLIVREILRRRGMDCEQDSSEGRLVAVGSIMRMARDGDVVWGTGVNGKSTALPHEFSNLDVRAVRGPLTAQFLRDKGIDVPDVYGDPGLLVGWLWPRESFDGTMERSPLTVIPNLHDVDRYKDHPGFWHPCSPLSQTIARIATSDFVVGSSLHAVVLADSFGIRNRLIRSAHEPPFKYEDYYRGTGRASFRMASDVDEALALGGEELPGWSPDELVRAFPWDLWSLAEPSRNLW
ncbi:pyruvyl transferase [Prescottella agglutinans]|uniref:Pyruvyl transferase n=2 Tax=Prescottella agglutinans TaxID=1644129 RepID=A0ABT6M871_9NOCA|nr:pyruvyl transferase [Prescottella agglutinans]